LTVSRDSEGLWVAPRAGAWIETLSGLTIKSLIVCRAPRGRVD